MAGTPLSRPALRGAALVACALCSLSVRAGERQNLNFNPDWKFLRADPGLAAADPAFDDYGWATVSTPHTFNDIDSFDHWSVPGHRGEQGTWGGITWYRKTFVAPRGWAGRKVFLEFEAVRQVAEVYLNGRRLGVSKTGFTPFGFDLTPDLRLGAANVLAVRCDNRFMKDPLDVDNLAQLSARTNAAIPADLDQLQADQIPWNNPHWHPAHGGIYRNVYLHVVDPLHISLPLYSFLRTEGPYVYATDISAASARIHLEVPVENGRAVGATVGLEARLRDSAGRIVLRLSARRAIAAGGSVVFQGDGDLAHPELWEPSYPYLYRMELVLSVDGRTIDTDVISCGVRQVRFDTRAGFFINGHHLKLHGWGQKPTDEWPGLGTAQPDWMHFYTLDLMRAAGGNWVRWGHAAAAPVMIAAGDALGIMAEQPGVDGESDTVGAAWELRMSAWRDMLVYFRNHPSIVIWEGGNQHVTAAHARELRAMLDRIDPHGGRAFAFRRADEADARYMDVGIGTEGGREIARLPVVEGEYDREESPRRVWDRYSPPNFGYPEAADPAENAYDLTSEEYAVDEVAQYVRKVGAADHSGGANWIFSDTTSGGRVRVEVARASGEVDGVRLPKEAYYVCAAMFRSDPQVHIIGHWTYPAGTQKPVYVASNGDDVELFVNGRSLGHGRRSDRYLFTFPAVRWEAGEIRAVASIEGRPVASETKRTAGAPVALRLTPILGPGGLRASGSDVALIDVEAVDARGERCPTFQQRVDFSCEGPGIWRGGYDSGKVNSINQAYLDLECGINRIAIRSTLVPGGITLRARAAGLAPAAVEIVAAPFPVAGGVAAELPAVPVVPLPAMRPPVAAEDAAIRPGPLPSPLLMGRFVRTFNYTGPTAGAHVERDARDGKSPYVDRTFVFSALRAALRGADWVQAGAADALYSAADLMQLAVPAGAIVSIAHDDRLARPAWLLGQFRPTAETLTIDGRTMTVFRHDAGAAESLTLGSNTDQPDAKAANMYVVFVQVPAPGRVGFTTLPHFDLASFERLRLVREADSVLALAPETIVAAVNPRSAGGLHDWSSEGDYWWPDPKNPNGPYIERDGLTNPGNFVAHRQLMLRFVRAFDALAAAYRVTGDERYAAAAVRHLEAWYVDPATRMNPSLDYSQSVKGRNTGRSYGVIDTLHFAEVALGVEALRGSAALTPEKDAAVTAWFRAYLAWLRTSPNGVTESKAANNHGTCWVLQAAAFAHLVGDQAVLAACRERFKTDLLPNQMAPDGSFPQELRRTKPYGYSIFNLDVMTALAVVLSTPGDDLMNFTLPDGRSLVKGVAWLAPYLADKRAWPKPPDVMYWNDWPARQPCLLFGAVAAGREDWLALWEKLEPDPRVEEIRRNFPIRQPVLWLP